MRTVPDGNLPRCVLPPLAKGTQGSVLTLGDVVYGSFVIRFR